MAKRKTRWNTIGSAHFANGTEFAVQQAVQAKPAFRVVNLFDDSPVAHSKHIAACWRAIKFAARITSKTERSAI